jgi:hypothetical protein
MKKIVGMMRTEDADSIRARVRLKDSQIGRIYDSSLIFILPEHLPCHADGSIYDNEGAAKQYPGGDAGRTIDEEPRSPELVIPAPPRVLLR